MSPPPNGTITKMPSLKDTTTTRSYHQMFCIRNFLFKKSHHSVESDVVVVAVESDVDVAVDAVAVAFA